MQPKSIREIRYVMTGPFGPSSSYTIDFEKQEITSEGSGARFSKVTPKDQDYRKFIYNKEKTRKIIEELRTFDFSKWKDSYVNPGVLDGFSWSIVIRYTDGTEVKKSGSNQFPEGFNMFGIEADKKWWTECKTAR